MGAQLERALQTNRKAQELFRASGNIPLLSSVMIVSSFAYLQIADYDRARADVEESMRISREVGNIGGQVGAGYVAGLLSRMTAENVRCFLPSVQLTKARSLIAAGHFDNAEEILLEALTTAERSRARMTA